jgi:nitroreductase
LENLIIAAEHFGYICQIAYFPGEDDLVASIKLVPGAQSITNPWLFDAILSRQDNVELFSDQIVSDGDLEKLQSLFLGNDIKMQFYSNSEAKNGFRDLVVDADKIQFADVNYRSELGHWWGQGMMGPTGVQALIAQAFIVLMDAGPEQIRKDAELVNSSHILGLISTKEDGRKSWIMAGQAFERLWLAATAHGICLHPMSRPLERPETKAELKASLLSPGLENVQQTFLLGYEKEKSEQMPRRPLSEILIKQQK